MKKTWMKLGRRAGAILLAALLLSAALPALGIFTGIGETEAQAAEMIYRIDVSSDFDKLCVAGNPLTQPTFTVEEGQPAVFLDGYWEDEKWNSSINDYEWSESTDSHFQQYKVYRYRVVFGIEHNGKYTIDESCQLLVGYYKWYTERVVQQAATSSSYLYGYSREIVADEVLQSGRTYVIANAKNPNFVLDVAGGSFMPKANVDIYKRNNSEGQAFTLTEISDGVWQIKNYKGTVLEVASGSTADKANVQTYTWNNSKAQKFEFRRNSDSTYTIINKKSGKALDVAGGKMANKTNVQQYKDNGSKAQRWILIDVTDEMKYYREFDGRTTMIWTCADSYGSDYALDIAGGSTSNKANLQLYKGNGSAAQNFIFTYRGNGLYSITNKKSGKVLDVAGGKAVNKANVQQYTWNGSKGQLWEIDELGECYRIRSALDKNYVLDLSGGKAANKKNIQLYKANGSKAQIWTFHTWKAHQEMG